MAGGEFAIRPLSTEEKRTTIEAGENTFQKEFRKKLVTKEQEFVKKHLPFCARCARIEFNERVSKYINEQKKRGKEVSIRDISIANDLLGNLEKYGEASRFTLLDEAEVTEFTLVGLTRVPSVTGMNMNYVCNVCGGEKVGKITVFVPKKDYEERRGIKTK